MEFIEFLDRTEIEIIKIVEKLDIKQKRIQNYVY